MLTILMSGLVVILTGESVLAPGNSPPKSDVTPAVPVDRSTGGASPG
jgi:hypothetical protein